MTYYQQETRQTQYSQAYDCPIVVKKYDTVYIPTNTENWDDFNLVERIGLVGTLVGMATMFIISPIIGSIIFGCSFVAFIAGAIYRKC